MEGLTILAIDPGPHTGWAVRRPDGTLEHGMHHNNMRDVWKHLVTLQPNVVVIEQFRTGGLTSGDMARTMEIQGSVQSLAWYIGAQFYTQRPADRMPWLTEARQLTGSNKTKIQSHAVDAVAHLLRWEYMEENHKQVKPKVEM